MPALPNNRAIRIVQNLRLRRGFLLNNSSLPLVPIIRQDAFNDVMHLVEAIVTADEKIADLEQRLEFFHQELAEAIHQRDRLALDAAWGVHLGLYTLFGLVALLYLLNLLSRYLNDLGWFGGVLGAIGLFFALGAISTWSNGARMKEVDRLAELPQWRRWWRNKTDEYEADEYEDDE